jgi:hypothetical protein
MAITITTLNNSSAVAKTFTEIGKDRANAEWLNTTDATATRDDRINIKQSFLGTKTKLGSRIRRSLVQYRLVVPTATAGINEELIVNVTFTCPETRTVVTDRRREAFRGAFELAGRVAGSLAATAARSDPGSSTPKPLGDG